MANMQAIADAIIGGRREVVVNLVKAALEEGVPANDILMQGLIVGMNEVGQRFKANEFYVPEVLIAARAMSNHKDAEKSPGAMEVLKPYLEKAGVKSKGKIILGTVKGDLHDIGKNLVCIMLKGAGYDVIDVGIDVPAEAFIEALNEHDVKLLALSALLTTTMPQIKVVIDAVRAAGLSDVKFMIGGAPVTEAYAKEVGAHGYAADAASSVEVAASLIGA